jgi:hypothetical protein
MLATTLLVLMFGVLALALLNIALRGRSTGRSEPVASGVNADAAWMPVIFSDPDGSDCSSGDAGCDGGGGD